MKKSTLFFTTLLFIALQSCCSPFFGDCEEPDEERFSSRYEPVFLDRTEFENSVVLKNSVSIGTSGKIYVKDDLLFINELFKGFHVYDNSDPKNPKPIQFLEAPGATDMAIRSNMVYINQATDLIAIDYDTTVSAIDLTKRIPDTFPSLRSPDGEVAYNIPANSVVVDWKLKN